MSKKTPAPATASGGGSSLGKAALVVGILIGGYGLATGQFSKPLEDSSAAAAVGPVAAEKKAAPSTVAGIPANYLTLYKANAGKCAGLDWQLLAGVGFTESKHGQSTLPGVRSGANKAGAKGPMQFKDPTWAETRGFDPSIGADVYNPGNAIKGTATYLCHYAGSKGLNGALAQYGGGQGYASKVTAKAGEYRRAG